MAGNRGEGHLFIATIQVSMIVSNTLARDPGSTWLSINHHAYHHTSTKAPLSAAANKTLH